MSGFVRINIDDGQLGFISGAGKDFSVRGDDLAPSAEFLRAACIKFRPGSIAADDEDLIFHIENSSPALPCSLDALSKPGFTTKENHSGLGLSTVAELLADCPYITVHTAFCDGRFQQTLTIHGNQENPK